MVGMRQKSGGSNQRLNEGLDDGLILIYPTINDITPSNFIAKSTGKLIFMFQVPHSTYAVNVPYLFLSHKASVAWTHRMLPAPSPADPSIVLGFASVDGNGNQGRGYGMYGPQYPPTAIFVPLV